jgi:hypothetical protein
MVTGTVNGARVSSILRDTGCSCVIVADETLPDADVKNAPLVKVTDYLGRTDEFPIVKCYIDCEFFTGRVDAVRAPLKYCTMLLGNIPGAKFTTSSEDCTSQFQRKKTNLTNKYQKNCHAVGTRAMVHRKIHPLTVPELEPLTITHAEFKMLQTNCPTLENIRDKAINEPSYTSRSGVQSKFISENDLLYSVHKFSN